MEVELSQGATIVQELLAKGEELLRELDDNSLNTTGHVKFEHSTLDTNGYLRAVDKERQHLMAELGELAAEVGGQSTGAKVGEATPRDRSATPDHASDGCMYVASGAVDEQPQASGTEKEHDDLLSTSMSSVTASRPPETQTGTAQSPSQDTDAWKGAQTTAVFNAPVVEEEGRHQMPLQPSSAQSPGAEKESHAHAGSIASSSGVVDLLAKGEELLCELDDYSLTTASDVKFERSSPLDANGCLRSVDKERQHLMAELGEQAGGNVVDGARCRLTAEVGAHNDGGQLSQRETCEATADHASDCCTDVEARAANEQAATPGGEKELRAHISLHDGKSSTPIPFVAVPESQAGAAQGPSRGTDASERGGSDAPVVMEGGQQLLRQPSGPTKTAMAREANASPAAQTPSVGSQRSANIALAKAPEVTSHLKGCREDGDLSYRLRWGRERDVREQEQGGGGQGGGGGGGVHSESYKREARFLTRWDQHTVAQGEQEQVQVHERDELWRSAAKNIAVVPPGQVVEAARRTGTLSEAKTEAPVQTAHPPPPAGSIVHSSSSVREPAQGPHEAWVELRYDGSVRFDSVAQQRLSGVLALVGFVESSAVSCESIRKSEVKGGQHLAIKVSICHQAAAAAWSRVRQAQDQIASRLACSSVHIAVQQPRWSLLQDAESTLAASSAPSAASLAAVREDATAPAGAGDALPAHMVLMEGFLLTKKSSTERQEPDAWSRRWFDLISSGSGPTQLRMFHVQPPDSCAPPLVLFSLVNAEISSLPEGFTISLAHSGCQLHLKCTGLSELTSWIFALKKVQGLTEVRRSPAAVRGDDVSRRHDPILIRDTLRPRMVVKGLAASIGAAVREVVVPLDASCRALVSSQERCCQQLDTMAYHFEVISTQVREMRAEQTDLIRRLSEAGTGLVSTASHPASASPAMVEERHQCRALLVHESSRKDHLGCRRRSFNRCQPGPLSRPRFAPEHGNVVEGEDPRRMGTWDGDDKAAGPERAFGEARSAPRAGSQELAESSSEHLVEIAASRQQTPVRPLWGGRPFHGSIPPARDVVFFQNFGNVRRVLEELSMQLCGPGESHKVALRWMPTEQQLEDFGFDDALGAIELWHGGMRHVASKLGLRVQGPARRAQRRRAIDAPPAPRPTQPHVHVRRRRGAILMQKTKSS